MVEIDIDAVGGTSSEDVPESDADTDIVDVMTKEWVWDRGDVWVAWRVSVGVAPWVCVLERSLDSDRDRVGGTLTERVGAGDIV